MLEVNLCNPERVLKGKDGRQWRFTCADKADQKRTYTCTGAEHSRELVARCSCDCHRAESSVDAIAPDGAGNAVSEREAAAWALCMRASDIVGCRNDTGHIRKDLWDRFAEAEAELGRLMDDVPLAEIFPRPEERCPTCGGTGVRSGVKVTRG